MTDQPATLGAALARLQANLPRIEKDKTATVQTKDSRNYKYDYANLASILAAIRDEMGLQGLAFTSKPTSQVTENGREFVLIYKLIHAASGETDWGEWPLPDPTRTSPQQIGSAITYARRYALCAVLGIAPDDDDDDAQQAPKAARGKPPERAAGNLPRNRDGSTSRSRVTDDELAATGQMTDSQLRDHNRAVKETLAGGHPAERLAATPDDDLFYDAPPQPFRTPQAAPPKAAVIHQHFRRLSPPDGPFTDEQRYAAMTTITGRRIGSTNDLTAAEGIEVGRFLGGCRDHEALIERLAAKAGESDG